LIRLDKLPGRATGFSADLAGARGLQAAKQRLAVWWVENLTQFTRERTMSPRFLLIALLAAFGFAALFATLTTARQLHMQTSAITQSHHRG